MYENQPKKSACPSYQLDKGNSDEIDLGELFSAIWKGKWIIISITILFALGSVAFSLKLPNIYKSEVLLATSESSSSGLSKMAGQLGGLAALAGVNIGSTETTQADLAVEVMKSRQFIEEFIKEHDLLVPLMAVKGWNLENNKLIFKQDMYDKNENKWLREPNGLRGSRPTSQEAYNKFINDTLSIERDKDSGLYKISIMHYSPFIAKQWAALLVDDINEVMRDRAISETTQNLSYLNNQLQKTSVADMRSTFYKLIEEQTKSLMLAEVQDEFVFKVIDPAVVPEVKSEPKRALICILGTLLGGSLSVIIVIISFAIKRNNPSN